MHLARERVYIDVRHGASHVLDRVVLFPLKYHVISPVLT